jgi:hypothetical protein
MQRRADGYGGGRASAQQCTHVSKDGVNPVPHHEHLAMRRRASQRPRVAKAMHDYLVDEALERYLDWRVECESVEQAYGSWVGAEGALRFAAYRAALDREEWAATLYGAVVERLERLVGAEHELAVTELEAARR